MPATVCFSTGSCGWLELGFRGAILSERFGLWNSVWRRFDRWEKKGIWWAVFEVLQDPNVEWLILDSTVIRAHRCAAGLKKADGTGGQADQTLGRSRGGFGTQIHAAVNGLGLPVKLILAGGQAADVTQAQPLLQGLPLEVVIADKGAVEMAIETQSAEAVVPSRANTKPPERPNGPGTKIATWSNASGPS